MALDPVAVEALVVSIPSAVIAVTAIAEPIAKRRRARAKVGEVRKLAIHGLDPGIPVGMTAQEVLSCVLINAGRYHRFRVSGPALTAVSRLMLLAEF